MTLVSIITPTHEREDFLKQCHRCVASQSWPDIEWLVLDDSRQPSAFLSPLASEGKLTYVHSDARLSIGAKRNALIERAKGDIIVSFDDDDYYGPGYVRMLIGAMRDHDADMVNLRGWFVHDLRNGFFGYWNLMAKTGLHYVLAPEGVYTVMLDASNNFGLALTHLGWGGTSAFKRAVWETHKFDDLNHNEDGLFGRRAALSHRFAGIEDRACQFLHRIHQGNTSQCLAQYSLPPFLVSSLFSEEP
jgi:glycosyltransferase involved in cell wall biosynthesis